MQVLSLFLDCWDLPMQHLGRHVSREHPLGSGGPNINIIWMGPVLGTPGAESPRARERVVHKLLPIQKFPVTGL